MDNLTNAQCFQNKSAEFVFGTLDQVLAGTTASMCSFFGTLFNLVTICALLNHRPLRIHVTTPFVISLATSDLLFSAVTLPLMAIRFYAGDWIVGSETGFWCQIFPLVFYGNTAATLFNILAVTVNRWVLIYFPRRSDKIFSRRNSKFVIGACWTVPFLLMLPSLTGLWGKHGLEYDTKSCTILYDEHCRSPKIFLYILGITLPSLILVITNTMIYVKIKHMSRALKEQMENSQVAMPKSLKEREQRLTKMMLIIFACFLMTYLPSFFVKYLDRNKKYPTYHVLCYIINWLSVIMNPAIYVATQEKYRYAICLLFTRIRLWRQPNQYLKELRRPSYNMSQISENHKHYTGSGLERIEETPSN